MIFEKAKKVLEKFGTVYCPPLSPISPSYEIICDFSENRTVGDLLDEYVNESLCEDFHAELWSYNDEYKDGFFLQIEHNNERFDVLYRYPFDRIEKRNYFCSLSADQLCSVPIRREMIFRIEYYAKSKVDWEYLCSSWKHPIFYFIVSDVDYDSNFTKCGLHLEERCFWFNIAYKSDEGAKYKLEYNVSNYSLTLIMPTKKVPFICQYVDSVWKYSYKNKLYDKFAQLFEEVNI